MEETKLSQPLRVTGQSVADCYSTKRSSALNALVQMYDNCVILCTGAKKNIFHMLYKQQVDTNSEMLTYGPFSTMQIQNKIQNRKLITQEIKTQ